MQRNTGYFPTESLEPCGNRLFSRSALNEGYLFRGSLRVESRRQIFWQVKQKAQRILCVFASIFVTVAGKSASEATLKASAVNCAVLP